MTKTNKVRIIYLIYNQEAGYQALESYSEYINYFLNSLERTILEKYHTKDNFRLEKYLKIKVIPEQHSDIKLIVQSEKLLKKGKSLRDYLKKCQDKLSVAVAVYYGIKHQENDQTDSKIVKKRTNNRVCIKVSGERASYTRLKLAVMIAIPLIVYAFVISETSQILSRKLLKFCHLR